MELEFRDKKLAHLVESGQQVGRSAYLVTYGNRSLIIKRQPDPQTALSKLSRRLFGGSLPFRNEQFVNQGLLGEQFQFLKFPRMLHLKENSYLIFEYVEGSGATVARPANDVITSCILELNTSRLLTSRSTLEQIVFNLLERPPYTLIRRLLRSQQSATVKFRIIKLLLSFSLRQRKLKPVLLHNDLAFSNVLISSAGIPYILDFEDCVDEHSWLLMDYVDLHFDRNALFLNFASANTYLDQLLESLDIDKSSVLIEEMLRLCLIRHVLYSAENPDFDIKMRSTMSNFLKVLADTSAYRAWRSDCLSDRGG